MNVKVCERIPREQLPEISGLVRAMEKELGASGRIPLRYYGTAPQIRRHVETRAQSILPPTVARLLAPIKKHLAA